MGNQNGYTVHELIFCIVGLGAIAGFVGVIYVAWHFISKFW